MQNCRPMRTYTIGPDQIANNDMPTLGELILFDAVVYRYLGFTTISINGADASVNLIVRQPDHECRHWN